MTLRRFAVLLGLGIVAAGALADCAFADEPCLDPDAELGAAGRRKGVQKRDFIKRLRLEVSAWGGFFASDLLSTSYDYGGAIAFYPGEDFGFEASLLVTPFDLAVERPLTQFFAGQTFQKTTAFVIVGDFVWSPIHLKLRVSEHAIAHGDVFFVLGAGDTLSQTVQGITFDAGIGLKLYANKWLAVRFDLRDYLMVQEAVAVERVTNNIVGLFGLSLFIPGAALVKRAVIVLVLLAARASFGDCVDPVEKAKLIAEKRGRREDERDFVKTGRHELTAQGGYYVSDLLDGTYVVGAAYTYHLTEDAGIEASFGYSSVRSSVAARLEHDRGVTILPKQDRVYLVFTDLVWSPVHGKMRMFADSIVHFDIYGAAGVGIIDNATSFGAAGQFGLGTKIFLSKSWAVRLDVRDQLYKQQILSVRQYVNDFSLTLGVSVFLPTRL